MPRNNSNNGKSNNGKNSGRIIMRIELHPKAKDRLIALTDKFGMTQIAVSSRCLEFLANQDETVQAAILGLYPDDVRSDIAGMILKRMAIYA